MRKLSLVLLSFGLFIAFSSPPLEVADAAAKAKTYKNCTELNKDYKGGVARSASVKNKGGKTKHKPFVSKELYDANKKSDRDKDLIACEK
ncbi:excalibur calcium-binding domain-containing protein [Paenibacillus sp. IB182493]|uniref:Excalibur calcium-binding domain-containing protein n=1 Tax=Paenibacillus arenilitoris TaxID=2772299 RepID=A0A927CIS9_9BACL|nr:excalibur calcium-binding domain-containing protein [Paenibacillus arenilitoris]MBD2868245.1 excalibur calcium-binding domain-containing protein [Paenibacillus arenilitoris]